MSILHIKKLARLCVCAMVVLWVSHSGAVETGRPVEKTGDVEKTKEYGDLSMSLSLTLSPVDVKRRQSIAAEQPVDNQPVVLKEGRNNLGELGAEIDAIEKLIDARQRLLSTTTADPASPLSKPSIDMSPLPDSGGASSAVADVRSPGVSGDVSPTIDWAEYFGSNGLLALRNAIADGSAVKLTLAILVVPGLIWYLRRRSAKLAKPSRYGTVSEMHDGGTGQSRIMDVVSVRLAGTDSMANNLGSSSKIEQNIFPPEYGKLEEAEIYLRFGHGKLAEEALKEAIRLNPESPHAYLALLRIYFDRKDRASFAELAQQLHSLGDKSNWSMVTEMGRTLDTDNPLYY